MPPAVCRNFQQGYCRFGDHCRFQHPANLAPVNNNRFAPIQNDNFTNTSRHNDQQNGGPRQGAFSSGSRQDGNRETIAQSTKPFSLDRDALLQDLGPERPQWILSAYGPGRYAPGQLFGGPLREQSFEEIHLMYYQAAASGNLQQADQQFQEWIQASEQQIQNGIANVDDGIRYIVSQQDVHPNRLDVCRENTQADSHTSGSLSQPAGTTPSQNSTPFSQLPPSTFGTPSFAQTSQSGAFGQPTALAQPTSAFGAPTQVGASTFGAPTQSAFVGTSQAAAFGAPTPSLVLGGTTQSRAFGNPTTSTFGAPQQISSFGGPTQSSAFGAPTQLGGGGAFGQASPLGPRSTPFGAPSNGSVFGNPTTAASTAFSSFANDQSPFTQATPPINPFGAAQPAEPRSPTQQANPFGKPLNGTSANPFGAPTQSQLNPFGNGATMSPSFGAPNQAQSNPFGSGTTASPSFGAPSQAQSNPFGNGATPSPSSGAPNQAQTNPIGNITTPSLHLGAPVQAPFGAPSTSAGSSNPFGSAASQPKAFSQAAQQTSFGNPLAPVNPISSSRAPQIIPTGSSQITKSAAGALQSFNGQQVQYKEDVPGIMNPDGSWRKIWFPDGPPPPNTSLQMDESLYDDATAAAYEYVRQTGYFKSGVVPLLPPKVEWCSYNF